jgi:hypothetical protein
MEFHYWHSTESFKHPNFTHEELHKERDRLLKTHARATKGLGAKLHRKFERLMAMIRHPEIVLDLFEIRSRRKRYLSRVSQSDWSYTQTGQRDRIGLQVPNVTAD